MRSFVKLILAIAIVTIALAEPSLAQSGDRPEAQGGPSMDSAGEQIKDGAHRIGEGAVRLGKGVKDGAVAVWDAVRSGASAAAAKLHDGNPPPTSGHPGDAPR